MSLYLLRYKYTRSIIFCSGPVKDNGPVVALHRLQSAWDNGFEAGGAVTVHNTFQSVTDHLKSERSTDELSSWCAQSTCYKSSCIPSRASFFHPHHPFCQEFSVMHLFHQVLPTRYSPILFNKLSFLLSVAIAST